MTETFQAYDKVRTVWCEEAFVLIPLLLRRIRMVTSTNPSWKISSALHRGTLGRITNFRIRLLLVKLDVSHCRAGWLSGGIVSDYVCHSLQLTVGPCSMATLLNHRTTLEYLAYLGYPDTPRTSALQTTQSRKSDRRRGKLRRNVLLGYVIGAAGSGKTSLLRAFVGRKFSEQYEPTKRMNSVVNSVDLDGREVYLVVSERFGSAS